MRTRTLPRHARTGLLAVGWRKARPGESGLQPVWPILGGAPDDGGDDQGDDVDDSDTDDGGDNGDGDQSDDKADHKAEAEKYKALMRKWQDRAKGNAEAAKELAKIKREGMSDIEKKVDEAVAAARAEERVKAGERVARSAFLAAAKGRVESPKDVADELNLKKYVDPETGEVDDDAIAALVDKLAPNKSDTDDGDDDTDERDTRRRRRPSSGYQGARNGSGRSKSKRGAASGDELFEELFGRKPRTTSQT